MKFPGSLIFGGKNKTPPETKRNANKVPILVKSVTKSLSINKAPTPTMIPVTYG